MRQFKPHNTFRSVTWNWNIKKYHTVNCVSKKSATRTRSCIAMYNFTFMPKTADTLQDSNYCSQSDVFQLKLKCQSLSKIHHPRKMKVSESFHIKTAHIPKLGFVPISSPVATTTSVSAPVGVLLSSRSPPSTTVSLVSTARRAVPLRSLLTTTVRVTCTAIVPRSIVVYE